MKKICVWFLSLSIILSLAACQKSQGGDSQEDDAVNREDITAPGNDIERTSPDTQPETDGSGDTAPDTPPKEDLSRETENREGKKELIFYWGGPPIENRTPATLYMGDGYSVYIPDEGWESSEGTYGGCTVHAWHNTTVESAQLQVVVLGEMDLEEAREFVRNNEPDFTLIEDKRGGVGGNDAQGEITLQASFYWTDTSMYAVIWRMDPGESEQIFVMLKVMAESFELTGLPL